MQRPSRRIAPPYVCLFVFALPQKRCVSSPSLLESVYLFLSPLASRLVILSLSLLKECSLLFMRFV